MSDTAMCPDCDHPTELRCCEACGLRACEYCEEWAENDEGGWECEGCVYGRSLARWADWNRLTPAQRDARIRDAKP